MGAAGSVAALGLLGSGPARASTRLIHPPKPRIASATSLGTKGMIGSTVGPRIYSQATSRAGQAAVFDGYVSAAMGAQVVQKYYLAESQWLASPLTSDVLELPNTFPDFKWIMAFRPSVDMTKADQHNLRRTCELLQEANVNFDVILWQEPNAIDAKTFPTAADYQEYFYFYRPYVPAGIDVIYDCAGSATEANMSAYFPAQGGVEKVYCDFYGNIYRTDLYDGNTNPLAPIEAVADDNGLPFGVGEWSFGTAAGVALTPATKPTAAEYVRYLIDFFMTRLAAGKTNGDIVYFNGENSTYTFDIISGATDWKTPIFQSVFQHLASDDELALAARATRAAR
jgi:hypothetical protein